LKGNFLPVSGQNRSTNTMNIRDEKAVFHSFHRVWETFCGKQKSGGKRLCGFLSQFVLAVINKTGDFW